MKPEEPFSPRISRRQSTGSRWACRISIGFAFALSGVGWLHADGKVFPTAMIAGEVSVPDQRAIVCWANGQQRLVIETRFEGEGTNFAWVVPLPSVPRIEVATTGVFRTLEQITRPELRDRVAPIWRWILVLGALVWLGANVRPTGHIEVGDMVAATAVLVGLGAGDADHLLWATVPALGLLGVVGLFRVGLVQTAISIIFIVLFLVLTFPHTAQSKAGAEGSTAATSVEVVSRQVVGVYDVEVISANDPQALPDWLHLNGYSLTTGSEPIIEQYAREGWVFAVAKVRRELAHGPSEPHPLSFTFAAQEPVYPLRLTGSAGEPLEVELYVFGDKRAAARGFAVQECRRLEFLPVGGGPYSISRHGMMIRHPLLVSWTSNLLVMTKLSGRLSPDQLERDASMTWHPFREVRQTVYSVRGATTTALNYATGVATMGLVLVWIGRRWRDRVTLNRRWAIGAVLLGLVVGGLTRGSLEVVDIRIEQSPWSSSRHVQFQAGVEAQVLLEQEPAPDLVALRRALGDLVAHGYTNMAYLGGRLAPQVTTFTNPYSGTVMVEEDSPGNYMLREREGRIEFVTFDALGGETVTALTE
jgi:hypothetical protein